MIINSFISDSCKGIFFLRVCGLMINKKGEHLLGGARASHYSSTAAEMNRFRYFLILGDQQKQQKRSSLEQRLESTNRDNLLRIIISDNLTLLIVY